ncbi:MAG TPA: pyrroloquinoline quinone biosynthesis protein PqqB [Geminicoccaceae bacterium]
MRIIVLGAAAGGGYPQWNDRGPVGARAWAGDPAAPPRTQCSLAVSADGAAWAILNASPDLRAQILATPALHPRAAPRHSPIRAVVLTGGEVDQVAGLLNLRESQPFDLFATRQVLDVLAANPIFDVLNPAFVRRGALEPGRPAEVVPGLEATPFTVPGKVPLYLEDEAPEIGGETGDTVGLEVRANGRAFFFVPGCARISDALAARLEGAELVFFDGTLWTDDEMIRSGSGAKTGTRMGHLPVAGEDGSMAALRRLGIRRLVYIHINNTNPILLAGSPERAAVEAAGFGVALDGMEVTL